MRKTGNPQGSKTLSVRRRKRGRAKLGRSVKGRESKTHQPGASVSQFPSRQAAPNPPVEMSPQASAQSSDRSRELKSARNQATYLKRKASQGLQKIEKLEEARGEDYILHEHTTRKLEEITAAAESAEKKAINKLDSRCKRYETFRANKNAELLYTKNVATKRLASSKKEHDAVLRRETAKMDSDLYKLGRTKNKELLELQDNLLRQQQNTEKNEAIIAEEH